ncbi:MAG: hypothetical protein JW925_14380 [Syntrophaceae bacterium]|nr:hypothetical protein [Syntrophaceae bacterium]
MPFLPRAAFFCIRDQEFLTSCQKEIRSRIDCTSVDDVIRMFQKDKLESLKEHQVSLELRSLPNPLQSLDFMILIIMIGIQDQTEQRATLKKIYDVTRHAAPHDQTTLNYYILTDTPVNSYAHDFPFCQIILSENLADGSLLTADDYKNMAINIFYAMLLSDLDHVQQWFQGHTNSRITANARYFALPDGKTLEIINKYMLKSFYEEMIARTSDTAFSIEDFLSEKKAEGKIVPKAKINKKMPLFASRKNRREALNKIIAQHHVRRVTELSKCLSGTGHLSRSNQFARHWKINLRNVMKSELKKLNIFPLCKSLKELLDNVKPSIQKNKDWQFLKNLRGTVPGNLLFAIAGCVLVAGIIGQLTGSTTLLLKYLGLNLKEIHSEWLQIFFMYFPFVILSVIFMFCGWLNVKNKSSEINQRIKRDWRDIDNFILKNEEHLIDADLRFKLEVIVAELEKQKKRLTDLSGGIKNTCEEIEKGLDKMAENFDKDSFQVISRWVDNNIKEVLEKVVEMIGEKDSYNIENIFSHTSALNNFVLDCLTKGDAISSLKDELFENTNEKQKLIKAFEKPLSCPKLDERNPNPKFFMYTPSNCQKRNLNMDEIINDAKNNNLPVDDQWIMVAIGSVPN